MRTPRALAKASRLWRQAAALAGLLILYNNILSLFPRQVRYDGLEWAFVVGNLAFLALLLAWARRGAGLPWAELGLGRRRALASALWGALLAGAMGLLAFLAFLAFLLPLVLGGPIRYEAEARPWPSFLVWALAKEPLGTALFEEVAFRGILQALLLRWLPLPRALAVGGAAFALWHLVINYKTLADTNIGPPALFGLAYLAMLLGLFLGGIIFGLLRQRTGSVVGPAVAHWLVVVFMTAPLYLR